MRCRLVSIIALMFVFMFSISLANVASACIKLKTAKAVYFPGETAQLEIDANVTRTLSSSDIFFYRDSTRLPIAVFSSKITDTKYFAWFDLPSKPGFYTIKVRGYCPKLKIVELPIEIQSTIALRHSDFKTNIENKWKTLPLEAHILAAGALVYDEIAQQAFSEYVKRTDSCVNSNCSTKEAALTLAAFNNILLRHEMDEMLSFYQNYFGKLGEWQLQISSAVPQRCNITVKNMTTAIDVGDGTTFIDLTDMLAQSKLEKVIELELGCENNFNATLNYLYENFKRNFKFTRKDNKFGVAIDNSGCWGAELKTVCDGSATSYALLALALTNTLDLNDTAHAAALAWLQENVANTEETAILYYITKDNKTLSWLLDTQSAAGFWSNEVYEPDKRTTALVLFVLKNSNEAASDAADAITKAEAWLKSQDFMLSDEAFVLFFAFPSSEIEPLLSVWPGLIKTASKSTFNLILTNKGMTDIKLNATLFDFNTTLILEKGGMKNMHFDVPTVMTIDGRSILSTLALDYSSTFSNKHYSYSIPLIIFSERGDKEYIGEPNATEQKINQTEQQNIINETNPLENKTTELNVSLIEKKFRFFEENLTLEVNRTDEPFTKEITLGNALDKNITNIELSPSIALQQFGFVEVEPSLISSMAPGEKVKVKINITPSAVLSQTYKGYIQASAEYDTEGITTNIPVTITVQALPSELLNCTQRGGIFCDPDTMECENELETTVETIYCCIPAEACKKKVPAGRNIGLAIVAIVIAVLLVLLLILRKKPKKEMKTFLEEKAKELEKQRIKRPPSVIKRPEAPRIPGFGGISTLPRRRRPFP